MIITRRFRDSTKCDNNGPLTVVEKLGDLQLVRKGFARQ